LFLIQHRHEIRLPRDAAATLPPLNYQVRQMGFRFNRRYAVLLRWNIFDRLKQGV
jgi:hypothetical protein